MSDNAVTMVSYIDRCQRHYTGFGILLICLAVLGACSSTLSAFSSYHQPGDLKGLSYGAADQLIRTAGSELRYTTPVHAHAMRRAGARDRPTAQVPAFAGVLIEQAARRFVRHGYNVQPADESGQEVDNGLILTGIYAPGPDTVDVEMVLKDAGNDRRVASFDYTLRRNFEVDKLLRTRPPRNEAKELMDQFIKSF